MRAEDLTSLDKEALGVAAIVGVATLAHELERLGLSDEQESLADARRLRPIVLALVEAAREDPPPTDTAGL